MVALVIVALAAIALIALALRLHRRRRAGGDLRDDWWPKFEAAFREYAQRSAERMPDD